MPDTSPNVPVPGAPMSREASAQAASADGHSGMPAQAGTGPAPVRTTIPVPESVSMVALLGSADELVPAVSGALFASEDLRGAVRSFLTEGPGKATYTGR